MRLGSVQSASVEILERAVAAFKLAQAGETVADAERLRDAQAFVRQLGKHADRAGAMHRSARRFGLAGDQAQQGRLAAAVAADDAGPPRPSASVSPSNSGRPSGVAREMESRITSAVMESFRNERGSRRKGRGDIHFGLHGVLGFGRPT